MGDSVRTNPSVARHVRAIYHLAAGEEWTDVIRTLQGSLHWDPILVFTEDDNRASLTEAFPEALLHDKADAIRGIPPSGRESWSAYPLDGALLEEFAPFESMFMRILDRFDANGSFTYERRVRHYKRELSLWLGAVHDLNPDVVVFSNSPHGSADYMLYAVCKRAGVPMALFTKTGIPRRLLIKRSIEDIPYELLRAYHVACRSADAGQAVPLDDRSERSWHVIRGTYAEAEPRYMRIQRASGGTRRSLRNRLVRLMLRPWMLPVYVRNVVRDHLLKRRQAVPYLARNLASCSGGYEQSSMDLAAWRRYSKWAKARKAQLKRLYAGSSREVDLHVPYVYLPLHYQPEATTAPDAGPFVDQLLAVRLLSAALPTGWRVYVREHPSQFAPSLFGEQGRSELYYADLLTIPGVDLVSLDMSPFTLIDHARAVATCTGTAGWEAVCRGVPVLAFGNAWYRGCHGVFSVRSSKDVEDAVGSIAAGFTVDELQVRAFIQAVVDTGVEGDVNRSLAPNEALDVAENAHNLARALIRFAHSEGLDWEGGRENA